MEALAPRLDWGLALNISRMATRGVDVAKDQIVVLSTLGSVMATSLVYVSAKIVTFSIPRIQKY